MDFVCDTIVPLFFTIVSGWMAMEAAGLVIALKDRRD